MLDGTTSDDMCLSGRTGDVAFWGLLPSFRLVHNIDHAARSCEISALFCIPGAWLDMPDPGIQPIAEYHARDILAPQITA